MIELKGVTKIYHPKRKKRTVALQDVSFTLGDRGFVFIVGKSGCGKSTLLNMMGGCDKLTAGDIVVDGNKFSDFHERDYDNFRNDYVGFIFQDYCLLEGLTVEQNVALALDLKGERNDEAVREALEKVELAEYANRYPAELSGGQKQRVAIARTLVKNPKLILADEPTGNLDVKSSRMVLELMKEMAKDALVVIVSHNGRDAEEYADRIIELSDGKIIGDYSRNKDAEEISFHRDEIIIHKGPIFTEPELERINARISWGGVQLRQADDKFLPTASVESNRTKREFVSHKLSSRGRKTLFSMFARKRALGMVLTMVTVVFLFVVLGICQFFTQFSPNEEIARLITEESERSTFILQKGHKVNELSDEVQVTPFTRVSDTDIAAFRDTGYEGGIYPLYNVAMITYSRQDTSWEIEYYNFPADANNYGKFFCHTGRGVLVTEKSYLASIYGDENGELKLLSGTLETEGNKIIVTDYFADSILKYNPDLASFGNDPYQKLTVGTKLMSRYNIAGVIDTGYKERYADLIEQLNGKTKLEDIDAERYAALIEELNSTLNIGYSFNPDFYEAYKKDGNATLHYGSMEVTYGDVTLTIASGFARRISGPKAGEVRISKREAAKLLGVAEDAVTEDMVKGMKLRLSGRYPNEREAPPNYTLEETVIGLNGSGHDANFEFSHEDAHIVSAYGTIPYALYFEDMSRAVELYDAGLEHQYTVMSPLVAAMYTVSKAAMVFTDFFRLIVGVLLVLTAVTLIGFGVGSVRKNMYEIAVVRALGGKVKDLTWMFMLQMLIVSAAVCLLSVAGLYFGAGLCNGLIAEGFVSFVHNVFMRELNIIVFRWQVALLDAGVVLLLTALAAIVPLLVMRKSKPREIIRAKE